MDLATLRYEWQADPLNANQLSANEFHDALASWWRDHRDSHVGLLGSVDGRAVAMAWLAIVDRVPGPGTFVRRCGYVQSTFVRESWRNRGLGANLMAAVVDRSGELGLDYLAVHPSEFSFSFYRRLGFDPTSRVLELDFRPARAIF